MLLGRAQPPVFALGSEFVDTAQEGNDGADLWPEGSGAFVTPGSHPLESALAAGIPVSADARRRSLDALVRHAESLRAADVAAQGSAGTGLFPRVSWGAAAALTLVVTVRLTVGPTATQPVRDALPGSFLHPVKLAGEQAHLGFLEITSADEWCALYERQLASERVREVRLLLAAGSNQRVQFEGFVGGAPAGDVSGIPVSWAPDQEPPAVASYVRVLGVLEDGRVRAERVEVADPP